MGYCEAWGLVWCSLEELSVSVGMEDFELESSVLASILDG